MSQLFEKTTIKSMPLSNRFVRSATWEGMAADDGSCTLKLIEKMIELARGGVGMIITGHTFVTPEGQAGPWQMGVYDDKFLNGLTQMTNGVHEFESKIVMQLAHAGAHANTQLTGQEALGPSVKESEKGPLCREISKDEIAKLTKAFAEGAERAKRAGFDGVQIHAAHGYGLSQFLSPFYNKRTDEYGGTIENRARIVLDILKAIREVVGENFPVLVKINSNDFVEGGFSLQDMIETALLLESAGIDAIEMSGGNLLYSGKLGPVRAGKIDSPEKEVFYREAAKQYKQKIKVPLILVGGIRSFETAESLVKEGIADYISLCRPLIREPHLVNRWRFGDIAPATCLSDNLCFKPAMEGKGLYCLTEERIKSKDSSG
jgi:2,4-dienoyl-CoA reductase-like NADH-dependent reductase (Old Yellow Enzyme family)